MYSIISQGDSAISRRQFLQSSSSALAGASLLGTLSIERSAHAAGSDLLKIALIGCGGRGSGAADQALSTAGNTKLVAMADLLPEHLEKSLNSLKTKHAEKVDVPPDHQFTDFDGYKKAIALADVAILATSPGFRPLHFEEAVRQGKHVFMEKPVATDAPGIRRVLAAAEESKKKNLKVGVGFQRHHQRPYLEMVKRIQDGAVGDIQLLRCYWDGGSRDGVERLPGEQEMHYQIRNWYYFTWLSGDFNVEQHIHMLDLCSWILKDEYPARAYGVGGRAVRTGPEYGNIYDHHSVTYEYESGAKLFAACRQMAGCSNDISVSVAGEKGTAALDRRAMQIDAAEKWQYRGEKNNQSVTEHEELFASIRSGKPLNNGNYMAKSTLLAIMGRMATYTGQTITWEQALNSQEDLSPSGYTWDAKPPESPIAIPGVTRFV